MMTQTIKAVIALSIILMHFNAFADNEDKFQKTINAEHVSQLDEAVALRREGNLQESIQMIDSLLLQQPNYYRAHYNIALAYTDLGQFSEAFGHFEKAKSIREAENINDPTLDNSIGWAYLLDQNYEKSEQNFDHAIKNSAKLRKSSKAKLFNNYAQLKIHQGDLKTANEYLQKAIDNGSETAKKNSERLQKELAAQDKNLDSPIEKQ